MKSIIIHVGPGKCGSSSIQHFFLRNESPCAESTLFKMLDPSTIKRLNKENLDTALLAEVKDQILIDLRNTDCLILSHESLFQCPLAAYNYCYLANELAEKVVVVGYSRRQSVFFKSQYSQWLFRAPNRIMEVNEILSGIGIDQSVFTGLERQLIASISNDFYSARQLSGPSIHDWNSSYDNLVLLTGSLDVNICCGVLPGPLSPGNSLIQDFCVKAGLSLRPEIVSKNIIKTNHAWDDDIIEAINAAIAQGFDIVGPHEANGILSKLSATVDASDFSANVFLSSLEHYIDWFYWPSNQIFCKQYGLDSMYFKPVSGSEISKQEIISTIMSENHKRTEDQSITKKRYQTITAKLAKLCINLAKGT